MCGIAGIISNSSRPVDEHRLAPMVKSLLHRGPDAQGTWRNENSVGLAHCRLSILDLSSNGAQPMHYLQRYSIVHNGEIYNYIELRSQLLAKGYRFSSQSDTEVILAAFDCWKHDCLQHFDGMFAFAIWDEQEQVLFAARDRLGEKPFYYTRVKDELLFASEMKALWAAGVPKTVNETLLYNFITLGYTQNPSNPRETVYQGVEKLPAANYFYYHPNQDTSIQPVSYWHVQPTPYSNDVPDKVAIEKFTELLTQSIQNRLRSDVAVGTSLSGGLDSSSIAVLVQKMFNDQKTGHLQTFSAVFPGFKNDESEEISLLCSANHIDNFRVQPTAETFVSDFEKLCYHQEGLMSSASVYVQYKVYELAAQHGIKVLLDGQGADEILAGYHKYYHWYWQELYAGNRRALQPELNAARALHIDEAWNWKNKASALFPKLAGAWLQSSNKKRQAKQRDLNDAFVRAHGQSYYQLPPQDRLANVLRYNTFHNGLEELLRYADCNSMAHGREVRLPFLYHPLVEYIFSLPASMKIRDGRTKWLLRHAMAPQLPSAIAWQTNKKGFEPPQQQWMQNPGVQAYIRSARESLVRRGILNASVLHKKIQPQNAYAADNFDWRCLAAASVF